MPELTRDVQAVQIPDGTVVTLPRGTEVRVRQALGGFYTVMVLDGMYRLSGRDGDAMGEEALEPPVDPAGVEATVEGLTDAGWKALKAVFDPEIPVDVVELGLVHEFKVEESEPGRFKATVRMGLTAPGCGMGDVLVRDAEFALKVLPGVEDVDAQVVLFPVWHPGLMSEAAKLKLGML